MDQGDLPRHLGHKNEALVQGDYSKKLQNGRRSTDFKKGAITSFLGSGRGGISHSKEKERKR